MSGRFMFVRKLAIVLIFVLLLSSVIIVVYAQAGQVYVWLTDGTYVDSNYPNSNYAGQSFLQIKNYQDKEIEIVWLKFDLSSVPNGAVVDNATLEMCLFLVNHSSPFSYNVHAYSCSDNSWNQSSLTYSNMPSYNTTSMSSTLVSQSDNLGWCSWNIVDAVGNALNSNSTAVTIILFDPSPNSSNTTLTFVNFVFSGGSPPHLYIHWSSIAVLEFPSFLILPFFMIATLIAIVFCRKKAISYKRL
jgi:hypothetical protein